jgi:hypothetical protein
MQLLVLESTNDDPVVKSSVKGIGAVTTVTKAANPASDPRLSRTVTNGLERQNTLEHTNSNNSVTTINSVTRIAPSTTNDGDARSMYPFRIKHLGRTEVYTFMHLAPKIDKIGVTRFWRPRHDMRHLYLNKMLNRSDCVLWLTVHLPTML